MFESGNQTTLVLYNGSKFYVGSIAINTEGQPMTVDKELLETQLHSGLEQDITAVDIYPDNESILDMIIIGTNQGVVEVWHKKDSRMLYICKVKTNGAIHSLRFDPPVEDRRIGSLFVCHDPKHDLRCSLLECYNISSNHLSISRNDNFNWNAENIVGEISAVSITRNFGGNRIVVILESTETADYDASIVTFIHQTNHDSETLKSIVPISEAGPVRDVSSSTTSKHFKVLYSLRIGQYMDPSCTVDENISANIVRLPSFDDWFGREQFPFTGDKVQSIKQSRSRYGGELFFDKLLQLFNISTALYPPESVPQLESMFLTILNCETQSRTLKNCLVI